MSKNIILLSFYICNGLGNIFWCESNGNYWVDGEKADEIDDSKRGNKAVFLIDILAEIVYTVLIVQVHIYRKKMKGKKMEIIISNSSDKPIYEQISMQVKSLIMDGTLSAGETLPSMRALAKDLHISVITVQRAYEDLTRDGFIETVSGKGSFVASQNKEFIQEEQLRIAEELLEKVAIIGRTHGISFEQMANILKLFFEE